MPDLQPEDRDGSDIRNKDYVLGNNNATFR